MLPACIGVDQQAQALNTRQHHLYRHNCFFQHQAAARASVCPAVALLLLSLTPQRAQRTSIAAMVSSFKTLLPDGSFGSPNGSARLDPALLAAASSPAAGALQQRSLHCLCSEAATLKLSGPISPVLRWPRPTLTCLSRLLQRPACPQ